VSSDREIRAPYEFYNEGDPERFGGHSEESIDETLTQIIDEFLTERDRVLELGAGKLDYQNCHPGYIGIDLSYYSLEKFGNTNTNLIQADMEQLPVKDESIDLIFSINALEHVPHPENVLAEITRVLSPGGFLYLDPAWFVRPWQSEALQFRDYSELTLSQKIRKFSIPLRNNLIYRGTKILPRRLFREFLYLLTDREIKFTYRSLDPNLEEYLCSDSDAFTHMDSHEAMIYFLSRGFRSQLTEGFIQRMLLRHQPIVLRKASSEHKHR